MSAEQQQLQHQHLLAMTNSHTSSADQVTTNDTTGEATPMELDMDMGLPATSSDQSNNVSHNTDVVMTPITSPSSSSPDRKGKQPLFTTTATSTPTASTPNIDTNTTATTTSTTSTPNIDTNTTTSNPQRGTNFVPTYLDFASPFGKTVYTKESEDLDERACPLPAMSSTPAAILAEWARSSQSTTPPTKNTSKRSRKQPAAQYNNPSRHMDHLSKVDYDETNKDINGDPVPIFRDVDGPKLTSEQREMVVIRTKFNK
ncbi:hypothetical protein HDU76_006513 [Blyttiomyces sp. JEL0837]|nr:hypothetical protein HDU76_006513 [Blyttiomyces sp. JEL0837]